MEIWDLWYPGAASRGLLFARAAIDPAAVLLVHAAPPALRVEVYDAAGRRVAFGDGLVREGERYPMTRLRRESDRIRREDGWPTAADLGLPVLLPGGEAGILQAWWNAEDGSEWRWSVEFFNRVG